MLIKRDTAGRLLIEDEGVSAIVDRDGASSLTMRASVTRSAVKRVRDLVADRSRWPTMRLRRMAPDAGALVPVR